MYALVNNVEPRYHFFVEEDGVDGDDNVGEVSLLLFDCRLDVRHLIRDVRLLRYTYRAEKCGVSDSLYIPSDGHEEVFLLYSKSFARSFEFFDYNILIVVCLCGVEADLSFVESYSKQIDAYLRQNSGERYKEK